MKTVRRPPYPKWNPGYFPCSSLTPLPLSSRRPSVSFGGFGLRLARRGCYLEYDFFGWEVSYFPLSETDMPNDGQRLSFIKLLVDEGYADRVVIAHDMFGKHRQVRFGGHGFAHILENIVPRLGERGLSDEEVNAILVGNPARILTFV